MTISYAKMIQQDFLLRDDLQSITLIDPAASPSVEIDEVRARIGMLSSRQVVLGGSLGIEPTDVSWSVYVPDLGGLIPQQGWTITDENEDVYVIIALDREVFGSELALCHYIGRPNI